MRSERQFLGEVRYKARKRAIAKGLPIPHWAQKKKPWGLTERHSIKAIREPGKQVTSKRCPMYAKAWKKANADKCKAYAKKYRDSHPSVRIAASLRSRLSSLIRMHRSRKTAQTMKLLGCSLPSFMLYLESRFEPGMSWENYGVTGWHIDHIMPCLMFDLTKPEHQKACFHFSNLQPMWAHDNHAKTKKPADYKDSLPGVLKLSSSTQVID